MPSIGFFRSTLEYLGTNHPDRWGVTLFSDGLRLNTGWVECLVLSPGSLRVLLEKSSTRAGVQNGQEYSKAPGCAMVGIPLGKIGTRLPGLAVSHRAAVTIAARHPSPRHIREAHSSGVTRFYGVADPGYIASHNRSVPRFWTSYWRQENWPSNEEYSPIEASGSSLFRIRGVSAGDVVFVVSQERGQLLLGGRMSVGEIVSRAEATRICKRKDLYGADEWVIATHGSGTPLYHRRQLAPEVAKQIRFRSAGSADDTSLQFVNDHDLDRQTTRGVRELTPDSAALLNEIIDLTDSAPRTKGTTIISIELLNKYRRHWEFGPAFHEESQNEIDYPEGALRSVLVNRYERDPEAREACIRHFGAQCSVCGFDFARVCSGIALGFIHVHHLVPLSAIGREYEVNPIRDLRPVCPNCHAVIHRRSPPYSIEELKGFISSQS